MYPWPQVPTDPSLVPMALSPMVALMARLVAAVGLPVHLASPPSLYHVFHLMSF